jgi:hypothetical protein
MSRGQESRQSTRQGLRQGNSGRARGDSVEVHIEELVLHGFASGDRYCIGDAIQEELVRLLEAQNLPASLQDRGAHDQIDAGTLHVNAGERAAMIGVKTARALHDGISRMPGER